MQKDQVNILVDFVGIGVIGKSCKKYEIVHNIFRKVYNILLKYIIFLKPHI